MSILNKSIAGMVKDTSRLESEKSFRTTAVSIEAISQDQTRARVRPMSGGTRTSETLEARVILTPGYFYPIDVTNYIGILHGDPKNPIGVQLIPKTSPRPDMRHGLSTSLYGQSGNKTIVDAVGRVQSNITNITQYVNEQGHPDGHATVIKPVTPLGEGHIGRNQALIDNPNDHIDNSSAYMSVSEDEVRLVADFGNAVIINKSSGTSLMGKLNIGTSISDVRIGGAWRFNPMMQYQIPSSAVTPIPTLIFDPPGANLTQGINQSLSVINSSQ